MQLEIDVLAALADVDDQIRDATRRRDKAAASIPEARQALSVANDAVAACNEQLKQLAATEHATERKVKEYQTHHGRAVRALETGAGDADAAERQRVSCLQILDELETTQLEQMDARESLLATLATLEAVVVERSEALHATTLASAPAIAEQQRLLTGHQAEREQLRKQVHATELLRYDALVSRGRRPVSPLVQDTCKACNRVAVARFMQELKRGRLVQCAGCGRWLHAPDIVIPDAT